MPFKTRQQKIAAEARRFVFSENQVKFESQGKTEAHSSEKAHSDARKSIADLSYIRGDLAKILLIASSIIILQIVLALTLA